MKIKVCGMRYGENIKRLMKLKPDFIGFIFYPKSKRYVGDDFDSKILLSIPNYIIKTGVFVNSPADVIISKARKYDLDLIQLHGNESPDFCKELNANGLSLTKVFSVGNDFDFSILESYVPHCRYFLFDTQCKEYGGSGKKFNWEILENYTLDVPLILSGGISPDDTEELKSIKIPLFAIDINSRFETLPGMKNIPLIKEFIHKIRQ